MNSQPNKTSLKETILKTVDFLESEGIEYFVLGGVAVSMIGEPRLTADFDLDLSLEKTQVADFLGKAKQHSFLVDEGEAKTRSDRFGSFKIFYGDVRIDFILASTDLEKEAFGRRQKMVLFGKEMFFPSPEDLILLKIVPGRPKDLIDAESVVLRHKGKLDQAYLRKWAQKICDEAEDFRVMRQLDQLLSL
ncbi:MAG: nucleotidyltransferase [Deltaproteobacteria bacterium]|nr:nucleotidyltransferase [Deltaproteobacteria bacterium]